MTMTTTTTKTTENTTTTKPPPLLRSLSAGGVATEIRSGLWPCQCCRRREYWCRFHPFIFVVAISSPVLPAGCGATPTTCVSVGGSGGVERDLDRVRNQNDNDDDVDNNNDDSQGNGGLGNPLEGYQ